MQIKKFLLFLLYILSIAVQNPAHSQALINPDIVEILKPKLNSERIEYIFGSYGIEVINPCPKVLPNSRISNLYSLEDGEKITRTLAIVDFASDMPEPLQGVHQKIQAGGSIGSTLKEAGWQILKEPVYFGEVELKPPLMQKMAIENATKAAVHVYKLTATHRQYDRQYEYCTIVEVHSPQYLDSNWLQALYSDVHKNHAVPTQVVANLLSQCQLCQQEM